MNSEYQAPHPTPPPTPYRRAVEIPCQTWSIWSHFIQDKLETSLYLSWDNF